MLNSVNQTSKLFSLEGLESFCFSVQFTLKKECFNLAKFSM